MHLKVIKFKCVHLSILNLNFRCVHLSNLICSPVHLAIGIFVHAHVKVLFHQLGREEGFTSLTNASEVMPHLTGDKSSELGKVVKVPGLDPLPSLRVAHLVLL